MKPKISVLIPALNEEKYIGKLLEALTKQTFKDFEVVVSGGDSKDRTEEVVRSYEKRLNLRYIGFKKNGVAFQRNQAAKNALSDHFIFLDADTEIKPEFLGMIYSRVKKDDVGFLTSWGLPTSNKLIDYLIYSFHNVGLELAKYFTALSSGAFMYVNKRAFMESGGFDEDIIFGEDTDLSIRIHNLGYKYVLLRKPHVYVSTRRFDKQGRFSYVLMFIRAAWYVITKGPIKDPEYMTYEFGHF